MLSSRIRSTLARARLNNIPVNYHSWEAPFMLRLIFFAFFLAVLHAQTAENGIAEIEAGRLDEAVRTLTAVVQRDPKSFEGQFYLGLAHFRAGRFAAARPPLERAAALAPANGQAWK